MANQTHCARCGLARSGHGYLGGSCSNYIEKGSAAAREFATVVDAEPANSVLLDRALKAGALEHLQTRIANATGCLTRGLSYQRSKMDRLAQSEFAAALKHLGGLGAS